MTTQQNELEKWLEQDRNSGKRAARFAQQAEALRRLVPAGSRDSSGNSVEAHIAQLEQAVKSLPKGNA